MRLLTITIAMFFVLSLGAQNPPCEPATSCGDAPLFCGYLLHNFQNVLPSQPTPPPVQSCFEWHNSHWFGIAACEPSMSLLIIPGSCAFGDGVQAALYSGCQTNAVVACNSGQSNGGNTPILLEANNLTVGDIYYLQIDGYESDVCGYNIQVVSGLNTSPPEPTICTNCQPGFIEGPDQVCQAWVQPTYTFHPPFCTAIGGGGGGSCAKREACIELEWNLPPGAEILGDPNAATVQVDFSAVLPGVYQISVTENNVCNLCPACSGGSSGCTYTVLPKDIAIIPPLIFNLQPTFICYEDWPISVTADEVLDFGDLIQTIDYDTFLCRQTNKDYIRRPQNIQLINRAICPGDSIRVCNEWASTPGFYEFYCTSLAGCDSIVQLQLSFQNCPPPPADTCPNFNLPLPPGDSCHLAPLLCGNYLQGYCSGNQGFTPDFPPGLDTSALCFSIENNAWLRFSPCEDTVRLKFTASNCQNGQGLETAYFSGDCGGLMPLVCGFVQPNIDQTNLLTGLTPGETYFLMVDGQLGDACHFQIEILDGIGTDAPPTAPGGTCSCTDGQVTGDTELCPGDQATYTVSLPSCTVLAGPPDTLSYCFPTDYDCSVGGRDSSWVVWHIPPQMHFIGDSTGLTIQVWVDSMFLGVDTLHHDTIWVEFFTMHIPDSTTLDSLVFCDCTPSLACSGTIKGLGINIQHMISSQFLGTLTCVFPEINYNGQTYDQPGTYVVQTACSTQTLVVDADFSPPSVFPQDMIDNGDGTYTAIVGFVPPFSTVVGPGSASNGTFTSDPIPCGQSFFVMVVNPNNGCATPYSDFLDCQGPVPCQQPLQASVNPVSTLSCCSPSIVVDCWSSRPAQQISWSGPSGFLTNWDAITVTEPGVYSVVVVDFEGCSAQASVFVNANFVQPSVQAGEDLTICEGETANLQVTNGISSDVTFAWSNGASGSSANVTPTVTTTYVCTATDGTNCCTATDDVKVNVQPRSTLDLGLVGYLRCSQPCFDFQGQQFCSPGDFEIQNGCETLRFRLDFQKDTLNLGNVGTLTCAAPCFDFQGRTFCSTGNFEIEDGCAVTRFSVDNDSSLAQMTLPPATICKGTCHNFMGQNFCTDTVVNAVQNCELLVQQIIVKQPKVDTLGVVGVVSCLKPIFKFDSINYTKPGFYITTDTATCTAKRFEIAFVKDSIALGQIATLTCAAPDFSRNGSTYSAPGNYFDTDSCSIFKFAISENKIAPTNTAPQHNCLPSNAAYEVRFALNGQAPFRVNGNLLSGNLFVSSPVSSGQPYLFAIKSEPNGCETQVSGLWNCDLLCATKAGAMSLEVLRGCNGDRLQAVCTTMPTLDADDVQEFILHTASGDVPGLILDRNQNGSFGFLPGAMQFGQTYFISKIAGNNDGNGHPDLAEPCFSCAPGQPIVFFENPRDIELALTAPPCPEIPFGTVEVLGAQMGQLPFRFALDNPAATSPAQKFEQVAPGPHTIYIYDANDCRADSTFDLAEPGQLTLDLGPDLSLQAGTPVTLTGLSNGFPNSMLWSTDAGESNAGSLTWTFTPSGDRVVTLVIQDSAGCSATDVVLLKLKPGSIYVPNAFAPSGEAANVAFQVFASGLAFSEFRLRIFDRWGELLFESKDPLLGWDGMVEGRRAPAGVYAYMLEFKLLDGESERKVGDFTLFR